MKEFIREYQRGIDAALDALDAEAFRGILEILRDAYRDNRQIFVMGNGGSAGTVNHFACDFAKNAVREEGTRRFRVLSVSESVERITAIGNDIDFAEIFRQQLMNCMQEGDVLLAVTASGNSPDILRACEYAREKSAKIIALSGFTGGGVQELADVGLVAPLHTYEQVEDIHSIILHMVVCYFRTNQEYLR